MAAGAFVSLLVRAGARTTRRAFDIHSFVTRPQTLHTTSLFCSHGTFSTVASRRHKLDDREKVAREEDRSGAGAETTTAADEPLDVLRYPHPALRAHNEEVTQEELRSGATAVLARRMLRTMYDTHGVGLAAPQVGVHKRLVVLNPTGDPDRSEEERVLVNPIVVRTGRDRDTNLEGCLSFPGMDGWVERDAWIEVEALDLAGVRTTRTYEDWEARICQHECDHLEGTLFIDHFSEEDRNEVKPVVDKLVAEFGAGSVL